MKTPALSQHPPQSLLHSKRAGLWSAVSQENFGKQEQNFESHYSEILETLAQKYEEKLWTLGERKREKLGALYRQLLRCGESLDTCRELMETLEELCHQGKADFLRVGPPPLSLWPP